MRLSALLCAAGLTTVAAFAPIGSQSGVSSSGLRAAENNFEDAPVVASFDPLNLATEEPASGKSGSAMSIAAATTAAWVASVDVASANNSPDWGVFEGVSFIMCFCVQCSSRFVCGSMPCLRVSFVIRNSLTSFTLLFHFWSYRRVVSVTSWFGCLLCDM